MEKEVNFEKRKGMLLIAMCWLVYTVSYIGKIGYSANIILIEKFYDISHAQSGAVSTFFFFLMVSGKL